MNALQKMLRNEITWAIFIIGLLWGCVQTVVLPLQKLQLQVSQIQLDLAKQNNNYDTLASKVDDHEVRISILENKK